MSPRTYPPCPAAQKKVIDDHCTPNGPANSPTRGRISSTRASESEAEPGHEVYQITDAQLDEWKKSAEPLEKQWAENVRKAGGDPDTIMKELKHRWRNTRRLLRSETRRWALRALALRSAPVRTRNAHARYVGGKIAHEASANYAPSCGAILPTIRLLGLRLRIRR